MRRYQTEEDYWRIRSFLREVFLLNNRWEKSWQAYRFDYWRWHGVENIGDGRPETDVFIWEDSRGQIVSVLNREAPGSVFLQVHPEHRTSELESEMAEVAEMHLTVPGQNSRRRLHIWVEEDDHLREEVLKGRGYSMGSKVEYQRRRPLSEPIPETPVTPGYCVRLLGDTAELPARSWLSWKAFHPEASKDEYEGWDWYHNIQRAPLYRRDLDLVAVASDGELAAFCTIWFDDVTRTAAFEPVGTSPDHQRRGLASAVMLKGLGRAKKLGATMAYVGSWNEATHKLYGGVGFTQYIVLRAWTKEL